MPITVYGIADCHGLESILIKTELSVRKQGWFMLMRAEANRHRHAVVYMAKMSLTDYARIKELVNNGKYFEALEYLKENSTIKFPPRYKRLYKKSWNLIPNLDLDPWSG